MKRVANCILKEGNQILMLQKPKRGWWVVPGGKIEATETVQEAVNREFFEETNLKLENPMLKGVFNIIIKEQNEVIDEWMLFTFYATRYSGQITSRCREGVLQWKNINDVLSLPKAKGDNVYLQQILMTNELMTGKFVYTSEYELLTYTIDKPSEKVNNNVQENVMMT